MCREAFAKPKAFAAILGIPVRYVNNARTMIALMNSKKAKVNPEKFEEYGDAHLQDMESDPKYSWNKHNPTVCKIYAIKIICVILCLFGFWILYILQVALTLHDFCFSK